MSRGDEPANGTPKVSVSRRLFVALALVAVLSPLAAAAAAGAIFQIRGLVHDEKTEDRVEQAQECVRDHAHYREALRLVEDASLVADHAMIDVLAVMFDAEQSDVDRARELVAEHLPGQLEPVLAEYEPPACDLAAARNLLEDR